MRPSDYLLYERVDTSDKKMCMVTFQEELRAEASFWLLGDSFLRAFYSIYDAENMRIGLVGDITVHELP